MLSRLLMVALLSGLAAGLAASAFQAATTVPLILKAEEFEGVEVAPSAVLSQDADQAASAGSGVASTKHDAASAHTHDAAASHSHDAAVVEGESNAGQHEHDENEWAPADGLERALYTVAANTLAGIGFGMLLAGCLALRDRQVDWRRGLLWGGAGFLTFTVSPFFGLPPELPGMPAADIVARQTWWLGTVLATAAGLALIAFEIKAVPRFASVALGILFLLLPHLVGAPQLPEAELASRVPPYLSSEFAVASLGSGAVLWLVLGAASGWLYDKTKRAHPGRKQV